MYNVPIQEARTHIYNNCVYAEETPCSAVCIGKKYIPENRTRVLNICVLFYCYHVSLYSPCSLRVQDAR